VYFNRGTIKKVGRTTSVRKGKARVAGTAIYVVRGGEIARKSFTL